MIVRKSANRNKSLVIILTTTAPTWFTWFSSSAPSYKIMCMLYPETSNPTEGTHCVSGNRTCLCFTDKTCSLCGKTVPLRRVSRAMTLLRGSVRAPEGFSEGKPEAAKPRGHIPQGFAAEGLPEEKPEEALTLPRSTVSPPKALS